MMGFIFIFIHVSLYFVKSCIKSKKFCRLVEATFSDVSEVHATVSSLEVAVNVLLEANKSVI